MKLNDKLDRKCGVGGISSHFIGVASELKAGAFFAERGYEVYFPMSSQSRCDFIASCEGQTIKVQVKTITYDKVGTYTYAKARIGTDADRCSRYSHEDADVFFFVGVGEMYLIPTKEVVNRTCITFGNDNPNYKPRPRKGTDPFNPKQYQVEL